MNIKLEFDYYSSLVFVPNGYITDLSKLQLRFFDWLYDRSECFSQSKNGNLVFSYNEEDFVKYINDTILQNYNEKAYCIKNSNTVKGDIFILKF